MKFQLKSVAAIRFAGFLFMFSWMLAGPVWAQIAFRSASTETALAPKLRAASSATPTTVAYRSASSASLLGTGTLTIARPAGMAQNDVLILAVGLAPSTATVTPDQAGWTLVRRINNASATANALAIYSKTITNLASEPVTNYTFTIGGGATHATGGIRAFSGVDNNNPIDVENGQTTASAAAHSTPAITTTAANTMPVATFSYASAGVWAPGAGQTERFDVRAPTTANNVGVATEGTTRALQVARALLGAQSSTTSGATNDVGNTHILALKPSLRIAPPAGVQINDVLIAGIAVQPSTATITPPAGWTLVRRDDNPNVTSNSLAIYQRIATGSEPAFHEFSVSGADFMVGGIQAFFDVDTTNPIAVHAGGCSPPGSCNTASLVHTAPAVTTTVPNTMLVRIHTFASSSSWTATAPVTESYDRANGAAAAGGQTITAGAENFATAGLSSTRTATAAANADVGVAATIALQSTKPRLTINVPAGTIANDQMIAAIAVQPSGAVITPPAGWTLVRRVNNATATTNALAIYRRTATGSEPASYIWDFSTWITGAAAAAGGYAVGGIQSFSGVDTTTPVNIENGAQTASALAHATPSVTTTVANTMVVTSHTYASSGSFVTGSAMSEAYDVPNFTPDNALGQSLAGYYVLQAGIGATGIKTATASGNADRGAGHIIALRPAPVVPAPGDFNAFETSTVANAITGRIFTKLVGTNFSLDIVAILAGAQHATFTNTVAVDLVTGSTGGLNCPGTPVAIAGTSQNVNLVTGRGTTGAFNVAGTAYRNVRIRFPVASPTVTSCSTDNFSIRPTVLTVTSTNASGGTAATNTATTGTPAIKTGANFNLRATALPGYDGTPSINNALVTGTPTAGTIGGSFGAAAIGTGVADGNAFFYSEVGHFGLATNAVSDSGFTGVDPNGTDCTNDFSNTLVGGRYGCLIGSTAVPQSTGVSGFGRFIPDNFNVTYNVPVIAPACGGFSYVGQTFNYTTAPVMTITARNGTNNGLTNATTVNYAGSYMRFANDNTSLAQAAYDTQQERYGRFDALGGGNTPALDLSALPATSADPVISAFTNGVGTFTFSGGTGFGFTRSTTTPSGPFNADIALALNVVDADGVAFAGNPASFGAASAGSGMLFSDGNALTTTDKSIRYGRLRVGGASGSQVLPLRLPVEAQYWNGTAFVTNILDACTTLVAGNVGLGNYGGSLNAGETTVSIVNSPLQAGRSAIQLSAPGVGNPGGVDVTLNLGSGANADACSAFAPAATAGNKSHLRGLWCNPPNTYSKDPSARARFGIMRSSDQAIYRREQ